jgi:hypothetical protein
MHSSVDHHRVADVFVVLYDVSCRVRSTNSFHHRFDETFFE